MALPKKSILALISAKTPDGLPTEYGRLHLALAMPDDGLQDSTGHRSTCFLHRGLYGVKVWFSQHDHDAFFAFAVFLAVAFFVAVFFALAHVRATAFCA